MIRKDEKVSWKREAKIEKVAPGAAYNLGSMEKSGKPHWTDKELKDASKEKTSSRIMIYALDHEDAIIKDFMKGTEAEYSTWDKVQEDKC